MRRAPRVLVVDDDPSILRTLASELASEGYEVLEAQDGREALRLFAREEPDLVLTDLAMPVADGFEVVAGVRRAGATPVVVLSVRGAERDKVRALDLGADDYVTKPFSLPELLARVRAQLRRVGSVGPRVLRFEGLTVDLERRRVVQGDREVKLTPTELAILELLATNAGKPVTIARIVGQVWRGAPGTTPDTVRVHVGTMRRKIEPDPSSPRYVVTEPWVGYRFVAEPLGE
ncbi:MAG: DNA-binding response regulator [Acidobacteria bacterium]|nr:MAG: DNA-binding response regulator [Acidobacteriota bacterium]MCE7958461.1 DNA-binding response regulator [Acidobacteria bacterium ACB2]